MSAAPPISERDRLIGVGLAVGGVIAFSLRPLLIKLAYVQAPDPVTLIALRMAFSVPFFLAVALWPRQSTRLKPVSRRDAWWVAVLGFIGYYAASFLDFLGLQYVSASLGRLLLFIYPTIVVILSALFLSKPARRRELVALGVTYLGVALVLSAGLEAGSPDLLLGAALVFGGAALYAVYLIAGSQLVVRVGSMRFTAYSMCVASVFCIAQFLALRPLSALDLPIQVYGIATAIAIGSTVIPVFMIAEALRRIGANQVALIGAIGPASAIVLGYLGLDETMTPVQLAGAGLVVFGVMLVSVSPKR